jgi:cytochrome c-type biogenesis protein CcmH
MSAMLFAVIVGAMCIAAWWLIARGPLRSAKEGSPMNSQMLDLRGQLVQLEALFKAGTLPQDQYDQAKQRVERQLLDLVVSQPAQETTAMPSRRLLAAIGVFIAAVVIGGYFWVGSPAGVDVTPSPVTVRGDANPQADGAKSHPISDEQISAMAERLAARLKENPEDAAGWSMLARSYAMMGRHAESLAAYKRAAALIPQDAQLLADYADSLAMTNNRSLDGEPSQLIERALKIDPGNLKALLLAGTAAFNRRDYTAAIKHWEKIVQAGPADNEIVQRAQGGIAEARTLAGDTSSAALIPPASAPSASSTPPAASALQKSSTPPASSTPPKSSTPAAPLTAAGGPDTSKVSGVVTLAPALAKQVSPEDTVFIFARAAEGSRMPIAILRHRVSDLPLNFVLDDGNAMSANKLSATAGAVIVEARVSKSGEAQVQSGDLRGVSVAVRPGASGLKIEISEQIR